MIMLMKIAQTMLVIGSVKKEYFTFPQHLVSHFRFLILLLFNRKFHAKVIASQANNS